MQVEINIQRQDGKYKDMTVTVTPNLVPDRRRLFYLRSDYDWTFTSDHKVAITNGLLSTINTVDEGKVGEILQAALEGAVSVAKIATGGVAQAGDSDPFLTTAPAITQREIAAVLESTRGDKYTFTYEADQSASTTYKIPGTDGLLYVLSAMSLPPIDGSQHFVADADSFEGIYAKSLTHAVVTTNLTLSGTLLLERRRMAYETAIASAKETIEKRQRRLDDAMTKRNDTCSGIPTSAWIDLLSINTAINNLPDDTAPAKRERYGACKDMLVAVKKIEDGGADEDRERDNLKAAQLELSKIKLGDLTLNQFNGVVMVPDPDRDVRIPINRASIGKTTNSITLSNGILTGYNMDRPAVALEIAKGVRDLLKGIVEIPSELIQFKIDTTGKATELAQKQTALEDEIDKLKGTQRETTEASRLTALAQKQNELQEALDEQSVDARRVKELQSHLQRIEAESKVSSAEEQQRLTRQSEVSALRKKVYEAQKEEFVAQRDALAENDAQRVELNKRIGELQQLINIEQKEIELLRLNKERTDLDTPVNASAGSVPIEVQDAEFPSAGGE
ncbi:MAG: hypothetical protein K2Y51_11130 [Gammaproteobacteria bacterium]|nr:hypothetical protein [Gammaproteobacteria bacterium]